MFLGGSDRTLAPKAKNDPPRSAVEGDTRAIRDASGGSVADRARVGLAVGHLKLLDPGGAPVCYPIGTPKLCFGKMLLPIDFSEACIRTAHDAAALARRFDSELTLLHVQAAAPLDAEDTYRRGAKDQLATFESAALEGLRLRRLLLRDSDPATAILDLAHRDHMALILMPTYGTGPYRKLVLGSVTEKVLQGAGCPVWTNTHLNERLYCDRKAIRKIVCAVERDSRAQRVLVWARDFARRVGAVLTVVHAISPFRRSSESIWSHERRRDAEAALNRQLDELRLRADVHVETGEVTQVVSGASENTNADLLVIGRSSASGPFGSIAMNSYSLIRHSNCPVVSV